jgi:hypothetical protein
VEAYERQRIMHFILDRIALTITLMIVIPAVPAIALAWGGWLIHQWIFDTTSEADCTVCQNTDPVPRNGSRSSLRSSSTSAIRHSLASEASLAA